MSTGTYNIYPATWDGSRRINPNDYNNIVYNVTGSQIKSGSYTVVGPVFITGSLILTGSTNIGLSANVAIQNAGVQVGTRPTLNFSSGSGINLKVADDSGNNRVNITIDTGSSVGTGGGGYNLIQEEGVGLTNRTTLNIVGSVVTATDDSPNSRTLITVDPYANLTGSVTPITIGAVAATGSSRNIADAAHRHATPSSWTPSVHASTHYAGGTDQLTGILTVSTINTSGGLTVGGTAVITGSESIIGNLAVGGSGTVTGSLTASFITGSSILIGGLYSSGNITGSIITGSNGFQTSSNSIFGQVSIISGSNLSVNSGSFIASGGPFAVNSLGSITREGNIGTNLVTGSVTQINVKFGTPADTDYINPADGLLALNNQTNVLYGRSSSTWFAITGSGGGAGGTGSPHNILSTTHTDSLPAAVSRGDLIIGNATPAWSRFNVGASGSYLFSSGIDPSWQQTSNSIAADYVIFSGSVGGLTGPFYAFKSASNTIAFTGSDAATVIQNAVNDMLSYGGLLFIKSGTYPIATMLDINNPTGKKPMEVVGEGVSTRLLSTGNNIVVRLSGSNISLRKMYLDGTTQTQNDSNMRVVNITTTGSNILLEDLEVANGGYYGINVLDSSDIIINKVRSHNNFIHGLHLGSNITNANVRTLVKDSQFFFNGQNGINDRGHNQLAVRADNMFLNNRCYNNLLVGLEVKSDNAIINGNYCYSNGTHGIRTETYINTDAGHKVITNNRCFSNATGSTADGIRVVGDRAIITGNYSSGSNQTYGINLFDGAAEGFPTDYCIIQSNDTLGNGTAGIHIGTGSHNIIAGNLE